MSASRDEGGILNLEQTMADFHPTLTMIWKVANCAFVSWSNLSFFSPFLRWECKYCDMHNLCMLLFYILCQPLSPDCPFGWSSWRLSTTWWPWPTAPPTSPSSPSSARSSGPRSSPYSTSGSRRTDTPGSSYWLIMYVLCYKNTWSALPLNRCPEEMQPLMILQRIKRLHKMNVAG